MNDNITLSEIQEYERKIGILIPKNCNIIKLDSIRNILIVDRKDGLRVFINEKDEPMINALRLYHPDKKEVIFAIGLYRGMQIANNYKERYHSKNNDLDYVDFVRNIMDYMKISNELVEKLPGNLEEKKKSQKI